MLTCKCRKCVRKKGYSQGKTGIRDGGDVLVWEVVASGCGSLLVIEMYLDGSERSTANKSRIHRKLLPS